MISFFDIYDKFETPIFTLLNPNQVPLYTIGVAYDRQLKLRYNALSELSFTVPAYLDNINSPVECYSSLVSRKLVYVENIGYFVITGVDENGDGIRKEKSITAMSYEYDFVVKKLNVFKGTYEFYDPIAPAPTLIGQLLSRVPNWTVGTIDADLWTIHRTFDITNSTIYNFLMEDVEKAYNCVFSFDYINRTISAYSVANATTSTDIYLSYDNLIQKIAISELTDELVTALSVYGSDPLSINQVNPMGTDTIYNFTHFKNLNWMTNQAMVDAVTTWENKVVLNQPTYANLLTSLMTQNGILLAKESELAELQSQLAALNGIRNARIQGRLDISSITGQVDAKQAEVTAKQADIVAQNVVILGITAQLTAINTDLSFTTNFTAAQQLELSTFIYGSTYTNENFIQTDTMTLIDIQQQSQQLYDQALTVLARVSQPRWSFDVDSANFVFLKEFQTFISQLSLGCIVSVEMEDGVVALPVLLEIDLNYDSPEDFKLVFGNRLRLDSAAFILSDLLGQSVQAGLSTSFESEKWSNFDNNYQDSVSSFMTSALNAALNNVISSTNEEIIIDQNGLTGKQFIPATGLYDPRQIKLVNNMIAFTKDGWQTASLALGEISTSSGSAWGLVANVIVGNLIAGNELRISNDANTFTLDGGGATLTNAIFKLTTTNGNSQILLDPQDGIRIRGLDSRIGSPTSGSIINKLWMDSNGNLNIIGNANIEGSIIADLGYIGGWRIAQDGLYDNFGNWIKSTGNIRLGVLSINGSTGIFNGNFYANNLMGLVRGGADGWPQQMGNIDASLITAGTMLADRIYGGVIRWPHGELGESGTGYPYMHGEHQLVINQGGNYLHPEWGYNEIGMSGNGMNLSSSYIVIGSSDQNGVINLRSNLYTNGMDTKNVDAFPNFRKMMFRNGLLVGYGYNDGDPIEGTTTPFSVSVSFAYGLGVVAYIEVPFNCHINRATIVANAVGSMEIDIYKTPLWNHPGTVANSIIPAYAYLTSSIWANCSTSTWNTALTASDILTISVHSMSSLISLATFTISGWRD